MRNKLGSVLWGCAFLLVGIVFLGNAFDIWNINLFFDGWWTLFIIIPCVISMIQSGINAGNVIGLLIGAFFLLSAADIISSEIIDKGFWPLILIFIGISILLPNVFSRRAPKEAIASSKLSAGGSYSAVFSSHRVRDDGSEAFTGANITAVFGGVELDLRDARIEQDVVIRGSLVFGGLEVRAPKNVKMKVGGTHIFGGVDDKHKGKPDEKAPILYVDVTCIFAGADVK